MNDEQEVIMSLYRDGKITESQKNALLAAIGVSVDDGAHVEARGNDVQETKEKKKVTYNVIGMENPYDASRISTAVAGVTGVKKATANITRGEVAVIGDFDADAVIDAVKKLGFTCKPVGVEYVDGSDSEPMAADLFEPRAEQAGETAETDETAESRESGDMRTADPQKSARTIADKLSGLGKKISDAVKSGLESLTDMEDGIAKYFDGVLYGEGVDLMVKAKPEKFDVPYESMTITVKIVSPKGVVQFSEKASDINAFKRECAAVMSDAAFESLNSLLERQFTGKYKYACGSEIFKLSVKP